MKIKNMDFRHKDLLQYLGHRVQYLDSGMDRFLALKVVYRDYKIFMETRGQPPLLYRQFRHDLQDI